MTPEKRPQDPHLDGTGCASRPWSTVAKYPDTMAAAIKLIDALWFR